MKTSFTKRTRAFTARRGWEGGTAVESVNLTTKSQRRCKMQSSRARALKRAWRDGSNFFPEYEFHDAWRPRWRSVGCSLVHLLLVLRARARVLPPRSSSTLHSAALALHAGVREAERKEGTDCLAFGLALFFPLGLCVSRNMFAVFSHDSENLARGQKSVGTKQKTSL